MRAPLVVVTGAIASGKSTVARAMAQGGGVYVDADTLAHRALEEPLVVRSLKEAFGPKVLTGAGRVSRRRLAETVFSDQRALETLNRLVRPFVKRIVSDRIAELRASADYIVLDAVLFFQYRFRFKADLVVLTRAPEEVRIARLMRRDGLPREQARLRVVRQRALYDEWARAGVTIDTDTSLDPVREQARRIRDEFLARARNPEGDGNGA